MKILWFTNTPSLYKNHSTGYNGGGWIKSLEQIIASDKNTELAISFFHKDDCFKSKQNNTTYYPIPLYNTKLRKLKHALFYKQYDRIEVDYYLKVIADFNPDVIHVFGSEQSFGLLSQYTDIPVIIHLQGILNPYLNAFYPPGVNKTDFIRHYVFKPYRLFKILRNQFYFKHNTKREVSILKECTFFMGRTTWDHEVCSLYSPNSKYYYCSEVLRDVFYVAEPWIYPKNKKIVLVSTISKSSYKGFDMILKTARVLKQLTNIDFEWKVFGVNEYVEFENKLGIKCRDVNVVLQGVANSETLVKSIQNADMFIHPSYIDNSPNSLCEAQILGIPVISTNVGGISSLIEDRATGYLVPSNDPFTLAARIIEIKRNPEQAIEIGGKGRAIALSRHNKKNIIEDLRNIYKNLGNASTDYKNF